MSATAAEEADYIAALKKALDTKAKAGTHNTPADAGLVEELVRDTSVTAYETPLPLHGIVEELARDTSVTVYEAPLSLPCGTPVRARAALRYTTLCVSDSSPYMTLCVRDTSASMRHLGRNTTGPGARSHRGAPPAQHRLAARPRGARRRRPARARRWREFHL